MKYIYQINIVNNFVVDIKRIEILAEIKSHYVVYVNDHVALWKKDDIEMGTSHFETRKEAEDYVPIKIRDICHRKIQINIDQINKCSEQINLMHIKLNELDNQQKE